MSDESRLLVTPGSSLSPLRARSGLFARGLRDIAELVTQNESWRVLAEHGDAEAQCQLAWEYCGDFDHLNEEDYANGARWFRRAAKQGHAGAQFELATLYYEAASWESSTGWARDLCKAIAAAMATSNLAVFNNVAEAAQLFRRAAEQGHVHAQRNLGYLYQTGQGLRQDNARAVRWYRRAAKQGNSAAQLRLCALYYRHAQKFGQAHVKAAKWYRKAAERGMADAQFNLGYAYVAGQGVEQDHVASVLWFRRAAEQGHIAAQHNLGVMYREGDGVQNHVEAIQWFRKAADQGSADAQANLGHAYYHGQGCSQDYAEAAKWFRKAAEQGHAVAQFDLGVMYQLGKGVVQGYVQAHMWINLAASVSAGDDQKRFSSRREAIAAKMTRQQIAEAQALARDWKPRPPK